MIRRALRLALLLPLAAAAPAAAQTRPWEGASVVEDPAWRNHFLGSYGVLSGVEPELTEPDRELLREVVELMGNDPKAAIQRLEPHIGDASNASLDFILANLYFQEGELEPAIRYYESALKKFPDFRRAHKNLGLLYVQRGEFRPALQHLIKAVELGDRDGRNYGLIGYSYVNLENYTAAESAYRNAIMQDPDTRDWKLGLVRSLLAMQKYQEAIALLDTLLEEQPDDVTSWMLQANAYLGTDQPAQAAVNLETVRMLGKAPASSLVLLGDIYMKERMTDLAKSAYLDAIESDQGGSQYAAAYRSADLLVKTRSFGEAAEVLASIDRRYKDLTPEQELDVLTLKAKVARGQGREADAARLLETIVKRDGTRGDALVELANYYHGQGQDEKAFLMLDRAQAIEGFEYQALLTQAQYRVGSKDYEKAAELLRQALQIKSEPRVEQYLARVEAAIKPR